MSAASLEDATQEIASWVESRAEYYVNVCTVHTVMECQKDPELKKIVNRSGMATPDGMPLVWLCHYFGAKNVTRIYGPDLLLSVCADSTSKGYRHFFYGGAPGIADALAKSLKQRFPNLIVAGAYSPPMLAVGQLEKPGAIDMINRANPDIVWVGLGTPKQDYWVARHRGLLNAPVLIAVGAAFDFLTGRIPQAPSWMQRNGLEWLFRLSKEPRRLAYRYLVYNPLFILYILAQISGLRRYPLL
ncbi:MAG: WecB/TagA/CpsF family glycosyltransferase [Desulfobacterota bacterium]|nr:WecB/TagA/CpsF family glycosyltransferase [Thermodesulfobacteriota bacterium]